jgi:hypothetical protein
VDYLNTNLIGFLGIGGFVVGLMAMPLLRSNKKESQSGCGCGKKQYRSEMTQDVHAAPDGELGRLNPTVVEGSEDIMGAENVVPGTPGVVYMQPYNSLTPQIAGPYYNPVSVMPTNGMPTNPSYYDGDYASAHTPTGLAYYDVANDSRPQYEFPDFYSTNYNPLEAWRPADKQVYNNTEVV